MPKITLQAEQKTFELKTVEGGFVTLRPLTFGQTLERRQMAMRYSMEQSGNGDKTPDRVDVLLMQKASRTYEFANCIVDHNLDDENEVRLNFKDPKTINRLPGSIGQEIEGYLDAVNGEEEPDPTSAAQSLSQVDETVPE